MQPAGALLLRLPAGAVRVQRRPCVRVPPESSVHPLRRQRQQHPRDGRRAASALQPAHAGALPTGEERTLHDLSGHGPQDARNFPGTRLAGLDELGDNLPVWSADSGTTKIFSPSADNANALRIKAVKQKLVPIVSQRGRHGTVNATAVERLVAKVDALVAEWGGLHGESVRERTLNSLMVFYTTASLYERAAEVEAASVARNIFSTALVGARIRLHGSMRNATAAFRVLSEARARNIPLDMIGDDLLLVVSECDTLYNQYDMVLRLLDDLRRNDRSFTARGIRSALRTAATYEEAQAILKYCPKGLSIEGRTWALVIKACKFDLRSARKVFYEDIPQTGAKPCARCYNALMRVFSACADFEGMTALFREVMTSEVTVSPLMISQLLHGCATMAQKPGDVFVGTAEDAWCTALSLGMEDDAFLWASMMEVYARVRDGDAAARLMRRLEQLKLKVHPKTRKYLAEAQTGRRDYAAGQIENVKRFEPQTCAGLADMLGATLQQPKRLRDERGRHVYGKQDAYTKHVVDVYGGASGGDVERGRKLPEYPRRVVVEAAAGDKTEEEGRGRHGTPFIIDMVPKTAGGGAGAGDARGRGGEGGPDVHARRPAAHSGRARPHPLGEGRAGAGEGLQQRQRPGDPRGEGAPWDDNRRPNITPPRRFVDNSSSGRGRGGGERDRERGHNPQGGGSRRPATRHSGNGRDDGVV